MQLKLYLESNRYTVLSTDNGVDALQIMNREKIDLVISELVLPKLDGYELIRKIRAVSNIPILVLTANLQTSDKILALNLGADDYLTKPFSPIEVVAHANSNLRRFYELGAACTGESVKKQLMVGELCLDCSGMSLTKNGAPIVLTPIEYKILAKLMKTPGHVYTKAQLYESIYGSFFQSDDSTMMVHMSKLRRKIESNPESPEYLKTIKGLGYKIDLPKKSS